MWTLLQPTLARKSLGFRNRLTIMVPAKGCERWMGSGGSTLGGGGKEAKGLRHESRQDHTGVRPGL